MRAPLGSPAFEGSLLYPILKDVEGEETVWGTLGDKGKNQAGLR